MKKFHKNCDLKTRSRPFCVCKEKHNLYWKNKTFETTYVYQICISKTIKICPNQHTDLLRFLFTEDSLGIKKGLELVFRQHFSYKFLIKTFLLQCYINGPNFMTRLCLLPRLFRKMSFVFHACFTHLMTP